MLYQLSHVRMYYGFEFSRGSAFLNTSALAASDVPYRTTPANDDRTMTAPTICHGLILCSKINQAKNIEITGPSKQINDDVDAATYFCAHTIAVWPTVPGINVMVNTNTKSRVEIDIMSSLVNSAQTPAITA